MTGFVAAYRSLRARPLFAGFAVVVLALAIGAAFALISIERHVASGALPGTDFGARGVSLSLQDKGDSLRYLPIVFTAYLNDNSRTLAAAASYFASTTKVNLGPSTATLRSEEIDGPYFEVMGVGAAAGRLFQPADFAFGAARTAVLSHRLWLNEFGGTEDILGSTVQIHDRPFQVIGIASPNYQGLFPNDPTDIWVPSFAIGTTRVAVPENVIGELEIRAIARIELNSDLAEVRAELATLRTNYQGRLPLSAADGELVAHRGVVTDLRRTLALERAARLWGGATLIVFLVAALNIAGLYVARLVARRGEFFVRRALGATRGAVTVQIAWEAAILAVVSVTLGLLFGGLARQWALGTETFQRLPRIDAFAFGTAEAAFTVSAVVVTTALVLMSALPFVRASGTTQVASSATVNKHLLLRAFGAAQVAAALMALGAAGIVAQHLVNALNKDIGVQLADVHVAHQGFVPDYDAPIHFTQEIADQFIEDLEAELSRFPGVSAAHVSSVPFDASLAVTLASTAANVEVGVATASLEVGENFFSVLGIPLNAGRPVVRGLKDEVVISESLARRLFEVPERAVGKSVYTRINRVGEVELVRYTVVGVAGDAAIINGEKRDEAIIFRPYVYQGAPLLVRSEPAHLDAAREVIDRLMRRHYPGTELRHFAPLMDRFDRTIAPIRTKALASLAGAMVVMLLAAIGMFATVHNIVAARRSEIALRQALGATHLDLVKSVLAAAIGIVSLSLLAGVPLGVIALPALAEWTVGAWNPVSYLWLPASVAVMLVVAGISAIGPARSAVSMQPSELLKVE